MYFYRQVSLRYPTTRPAAAQQQATPFRLQIYLPLSPLSRRTLLHRLPHRTLLPSPAVVLTALAAETVEMDRRMGRLATLPMDQLVGMGRAGSHLPRRALRSPVSTRHRAL